jgi:DNA-binding MarR family transcriptional regulator
MSQALSGSTTAAPPLSASFEDAWQAVRATNQLLSDRIGHELSDAGLPELSWYDVLARLEDRPEPLRPKDLLCRVGVTKSGLTRLLDRIEAAGLIERTSCPSDRRGTFIVITDEGRQTLAAMRPIRNRIFAEHFAGSLSEADAEALTSMLARVGDSLRDELEGDGRCEV